MKDLMKKVVILENLSSPFVHQAIIVMKDYNPQLESKAVIEAERIVAAYLDNVKLNNGRLKKQIARKKKFQKTMFITGISALILCIATFLITHL